MANSSIFAAFERMWQHVVVALNNKSSANNLENGTGDGALKQKYALSAGGINSFAIGQSTEANGRDSFATGRMTVASGEGSHAEGLRTIAQGSASHAEGGHYSENGRTQLGSHTVTVDGQGIDGIDGSKAVGVQSHVEGTQTYAGGYGAHAEGQWTVANGENSHAEGLSSQAIGECSHAEGFETLANGYYSHAEGYGTAASGNYSHAEGLETKAFKKGSHAEGYNTKAFGNASHAEGGNLDKQGTELPAWEFTDKDGEIVLINGSEAYAPGSHAEGTQTYAADYSSHAEGLKTVAEGDAAHAEGSNTIARGNYSHSEGLNTTASGPSSHAEGNITIASGTSSHAEGGNTVASGFGSHAEGDYTIAASSYQHAQGKFNIEDSADTYAHIVGNGSSSARSNAHTLDWDGNAWFAGDVYVGSTSGTNKDEGSVKLATEGFVQAEVANLVNSAPDKLNTLDELAAALGDDENFATTVTNKITSAQAKADNAYGLAETKQNKITGTAGQVVGFDASGNAVAQEAPAGAKVYTATIGTSWTENEDTGVKTQTVSIPEITASNTAKVDHASTSVNGTSDGYATFVEEENQYLTYVTNGYAETIDGGIKFYIFGDANTVSIPIVVEVV